MKAAIVGAGLAGLNAARRLEAAGVEVRLFEKARGAAGRLATRRTDHGHFDHGAQYLTARGPGFRAQVDDWIARGVAAPWDGRVVRIEAGERFDEEHPPARFVGLPGMSGLARDLRGDRAVELGVRIQAVERAREHWTLRSETGLVHGPYDALVVAVPAPQALPLVESVPALCAAVAQVRMRPCHAVMATFETPVDADFDAAFVDDGVLSWVARAGSKPGRTDEPRWTLHSQADWSDAGLDLAPEEVARTLLAAFSSTLGRPLPGLRFSASHRWLYARPDAPMSGVPLWHPEHALGVCGDWVQGDRVEDAFESAERLVQEMAPSLPLR